MKDIGKESVGRRNRTNIQKHKAQHGYGIARSVAVDARTNMRAAELNYTQIITYTVSNGPYIKPEGMLQKMNAGNKSLPLSTKRRTMKKKKHVFEDTESGVRHLDQPA